MSRKPLEGKSKGGIKVHTMLNAYEEVPQLIHFTDGATHDPTFLSKLTLRRYLVVETGGWLSGRKVLVSRFTPPFR